MIEINLAPVKPDFSAWEISKSLKILLIKENKWNDHFLIDPSILAAVLNTLYEQIKRVNFFNSPAETTLFFKFLRALVESKPHNDEVLREFSQITAEILDKLTLETRFDNKQEKVVLHYLKLLALMLEPKHRYLFEKPEIGLWTNDFQKISRTPFNSSELLSQFRNTLQLSFQSTPFIKNYPALIQTISELACSLDKANIDSNELAAMKLFDTLGALDHTLKTTQVYRIKINQASVKQSIQQARNLVYNEFIPYVEENFLQFIVYKSYLTRSYPNSTNLIALCNAENYRAQCQSDYIRFKDSYRCITEQFIDFSIDIKNNNHSKLDLDRLCMAMRTAESFIDFLKEFGLNPYYNESQYSLHMADSKKNFRIDKFLFEREDTPETSHTVLATYFQLEKSTSIEPLSGSTYTYTTDLHAIIHEYIHHLYSLFVKNIEFDLTSTEGVAELYAAGVCPINSMHDLRNFVNDTFIFEFLKTRRYPFYFNALKWVGYLVNEQPLLFTKLVSFLQKNDTQNFYASLDSFIGNATNIKSFVDWSNQQVNTCNQYWSIFPEGHQPPLIYLDSVKAYLNQTPTIEQSSFNFHNARKRDLLVCSHNEPYETVSYSTIETKSAFKEFNQQVRIGMPLLSASFLAGLNSIALDDLGLSYKDKCPSLPAYINYGLKPLVFAVVSAGLNSLLFDRTVEAEEKFARLFTYFVMNYLSVIIGQPLTQKIAEKIQNKILCFFVQMLTWTLLWNPSLFISENNKILPTLFLQLAQGFCFKAGEETFRLGKNICSSVSSFWYKKQPQALTIEDAFIANDQEMQLNKITLGSSF